MNRNSAILVVGHDDIIDNSLFNYFKTHNFKKVYSSSHAGLDVLSQRAVRSFLETKKIDYVFLSSTESGGIVANQKYAAEFIYSNLESQNNIIHAAYQSNVKKLMYFAGSCVYPKQAPQPIKEKCLLTGPLEVTSEPYSVAKIAGIKLCQTYKRQYGFNAVVAIPATIYGPGSDVDITTAHVIGALIGKFCETKACNEKKVVVWGSGKPRREFLYADDFVDACLFLMDHYEDAEMINVGCGFDVSIKELVEMIAEISGFEGKIVFDRTKPDGTMRKLMDNSRIKRLGWRPKVSLKEGIRKTCQWYTKKRS